MCLDIRVYEMYNQLSLSQQIDHKINLVKKRRVNIYIFRFKPIQLTCNPYENENNDNINTNILKYLLAIPGK